MGRNRRMKHEVPESVPGPSSSNNHAYGKKLSKTELGGAIFGCKHDTMGECLAKKLFGLTFPQINFVKNIEPGLTLFLFNYNDRKMHGIFEASSPGNLNIDPYAWTNADGKKTNFPAQVRIQVRMQCQPITERQFKKVIGDNYYSNYQFSFQLNHAQTEGLIKLFLASGSIKAREPPLILDENVRIHGTAGATLMNTAHKREIRGSHSYIDQAKEENTTISLTSASSDDSESREREVHVIRKPCLDPNCLVDFHTPYVPEDVNEGSMLPGNPLVPVERENEITSDSFKRKTELMDTIEALKERAAALESEQMQVKVLKLLKKCIRLIT